MDGPSRSARPRGRHSARQARDAGAVSRGDRADGARAGEAARAGQRTAGEEAGLAQLVEAAVVGRAWVRGQPGAAPGERSSQGSAAWAQGHVPGAAGGVAGGWGPRLQAASGVRVWWPGDGGQADEAPGVRRAGTGEGRGAGVPAVLRGVRALPQDARVGAAGRGSQGADRAEGAGPGGAAGHGVPPDAAEDPGSAGAGAGGEVQRGSLSRRRTGWWRRR